MPLPARVWYFRFQSFINSYWFWLLAALLLYSGVMNSYFVSDDFDFLRNMAGSGHPWWWWLVNPQNSGVLFYRPLHNWYFLIHKSWFGLNPWGYHLTLIVFHSLAAWVLFKALIKTGKIAKSLAGLTALLFLVAPVQAESVAWISGGVSVLAGFPAMIAWYAWVKARITGKKSWWAMSAAAWFIALLAKESVITWPLVLIVLDCWLWPTDKIFNKIKQLIRPLVYFLGAGIVYFILRWGALDTWLGGYGVAVHSSLDIEAMSKMTAGAVISFFANGSIKYSLTQLAYNYLPGFYLLLGVLMAGGLIIARSNRRWFVGGAIIFILSLLPQINLGINIMDTQGERYLYLPAFGLALMLASVILSNQHRVKARAIGGGLLVLFFVILLLPRLNHWRQAGEYTKKAVVQFAPYVSSSLTAQQVFIGLPDNIGGAFIFRNGFNEALKLTYPNYEPSRWLIPMRLYLTRAPIYWEKSGPKIIGQSADLVFTLTNQSDYFNHQLMAATVIEQRYHFILGRGYQIVGNDKFSRVQERWPIQYFVFDRDGLRLFDSEAKY